MIHRFLASDIYTSEYRAAGTQVLYSHHGLMIEFTIARHLIVFLPVALDFLFF